MTSQVILDSDWIQNAFKAGGIPLVEKYFSK
jgi:hypothetical protein